MDSKRAVGGFCTFCGGLVVNILQATEPHWFGDHAWILPASFVVLLVGLLVWLCQYRWAQRVLGILPRENASTTVPGLSVAANGKAVAGPGGSESPTSEPPSRLKIIEARYGIEGGPDIEVTEQYLKPRLHGDSLVGFVGADLFGAFQPHTGPPPKRLKVRYAFDGQESMILRTEGQMIVLPEDRFLKEQLETCQRDKALEGNQARSELYRMQQFYDQCKAEKKELAAKVERFTPLQWEAVQLADDLLRFLLELGPPPAPKYTEEEIRRMPEAQSRKLVESNDGEYAEACEYHFGKGTMRLSQEGLYQQLTAHNRRLWPWYDKVADAYDERFKGKVESMKRRLTVEGMAADSLLVTIGGPHGAANIRAIAAKLWELAYGLKEKGLPNYEDPRISQGSSGA